MSSSSMIWSRAASEHPARRAARPAQGVAILARGTCRTSAEVRLVNVFARLCLTCPATAPMIRRFRFLDRPCRGRSFRRRGREAFMQIRRALAACVRRPRWLCAAPVVAQRNNDNKQQPARSSAASRRMLKRSSSGRGPAAVGCGHTIPPSLASQPADDCRCRRGAAGNDEPDSTSRRDCRHVGVEPLHEGPDRHTYIPFTLQHRSVEPARQDAALYLRVVNADQAAAFARS